VYSGVRFDQQQIGREKGRIIRGPPGRHPSILDHEQVVVGDAEHYVRTKGAVVAEYSVIVATCREEVEGALMRAKKDAGNGGRQRRTRDQEATLWCQREIPVYDSSGSNLQQDLGHVGARRPIRRMVLPPARANCRCRASKRVNKKDLRKKSTWRCETSPTGNRSAS
jgi:hypothetical protein